MKRLIKFLPKLVMLCFACLLVLALVACGETGGSGDNPDDGGNPGGKEHQWTENELYWDADKNGKPDWTEKEITLRYATWQYTDPNTVTIDTLMVEAFMEKYPNIHVEMQIVGYDEIFENNLLQLLEASTEENKLPDVFLIERLEHLLPYNILADITEYFNHDDDTEYIFESVKDLGLYNGKRYCVPTFIYPEIWIVNKKLLADCNIAAPSYDWTWEQMELIAKKVSESLVSDHAIGVYGTEQYYFELPKILKTASNAEAGAKWLAYGYDGQQFNFDDLAYINAVAKMEAGMHAGWLVDSLAPSTLSDYYGSDDDPRYAGHVAIWREPTWSFKNDAHNIQFDWDVYPGPNGISGGNTDIAGVCQLCENKAAAYQLLKWMSFGQDGMVKRYEIYEEYGEELYISANNYPYPVVDYGPNAQGDNLIWDHIPYTQTAAGFGAPEFPESLRKGAIKANKEVIGWDAAENAFKDYLYQVVMGQQNYATLYETIQSAAMQSMDLKRQAINDALGSQSN